MQGHSFQSYWGKGKGSIFVCLSVEFGVCNVTFVISLSVTFVIESVMPVLVLSVCLKCFHVSRCI